MSNAQHRDYDIVIAGGGMVGTCLAIALAPLELRVAVVEAVDRQAAAQPSFDDRTTALSRSSQRLFDAIGLWDDVRAASTPICSIHVSERSRFGFSHIDAEEQRVEALGYVVINRVLGAVLQRELGRHDNVDMLCPARIVGVEANGTGLRVNIDGRGVNEPLNGRLLVAADGARSAVRDMLGIGATHTDYGQHAIIGNLRSERRHRNRAFERFTGDGAIAMLPIGHAGEDGGNRSAFVWITAFGRTDELMGADDEHFLGALQAEFGHRLGAFSRVGKRACYPLALSKANSLHVARAVVVGNAAHGLHPVAAQGFNLGLRDVAALTECIADGADSANNDPGAPAILERYAGWRRADQQKLVRFTDGLIHLFGDRRESVRALRNAGMLGFDLLPGVRRLFARHTMGLAGTLPKLSRGVPLR